MSELHFGRYAVEITNPGKVFFPESKITKGDVVDYYIEVAPIILPHIADRLIVMQRFPEGIEGESFYHKAIPDYFPDWIDRQTVKKEDGTITHLLCQNAATLAYIANQGCITPHTWLSRRDRVDYPDQLVFDLDPSSDEDAPEVFAGVRRVAFALKDLLEHLGLRAFVKTSGSRGVHIITPLDRSANFDESREFARGIAAVLADRDPDHVTTEQRKTNRNGKIYLDVARNGYAQTVAPAYALRPLPHAPISTPLEWNELMDSALHAQSYHLGNIRKRLARKRDPWAGISRQPQSLAEARRRLEVLEPASFLKRL